MAENNPPLKELVSSEYKKYSQTSLKYPDNVDSLAHLMLFNINVNEFSSDLLQENQSGGIRENQLRTRNERSRTDVLRGDVGGLQQFTRLGIDLGGVGKTSRKTIRVENSIALYVPETMIFDDNQSYQDLSITKEFGTLSTFAGEFAAQQGAGQNATAAAVLGGAVAGNILSRLGNVFGKRLDNIGPIGTTIKGAFAAGGKAALTGLRLAGFAVNPMIEVIYNNPNLRQFQFDFSFAPRTQKEAQEVGRIIKTFRRHQAPEFNATTGIQGAVFLPPSEFDISFHYNTNNGFTENLNFPRISTCVLKTVNTNFAPNMFSTFRDGSSVNITLRLAFQELDMITRDRVDAGF